MSNSLLSQTEPDALVNFNLNRLLLEFKAKLPCLTNIIESACSINVKRRKNINKTVESVVPNIVTLIGKILSTHNERLSALKYIYGILLKEGGAMDTCITRLSYTGDSVTPQSLSGKIKRLSEHAITKLQSWDEPHSNSCIVFDNLNPYIEVHQQTSSKKSKLYHLTHAIAVKFKRPVAQSGPPLFSLHTIEPQNLLPTTHDEQEVLCHFSVAVRNIWAEHIPGLAWMAADRPEHMSSNYSDAKTELVGGRLRYWL